MPKPSMYRQKRALITGGAGFIGSHLARQLDRLGAKVRVLDDLSSGRKENLYNINHDFVLGSILDTNCLSRAMRDIDVVFHMAGFVSVPNSFIQEALCMATNHLGTLNTLRAAGLAGVNRVLFAGTAAVYGDSPPMPCREQDITAPSSPYALSKLAAEQLIVEWGQNTKLDTVSLRLFNVYGGGSNKSSIGVVDAFATSIRSQGYGTILGDGLNTRDFIYIDDVVQAMIQAGFRQERLHGKILNIGSGVSTSVLALHKIMACKIAPQSPTTPSPRIAPKRRGDARDSVASIENARTELSWAPQFTLERGIHKMLASSQLSI